MRNTRKEIGGWRFDKPEQVIQLGVIVESINLDQLHLRWVEAEEDVKGRLPEFHRNDFFFMETFARGEVTYSFRYYTPITNRRRVPQVALVE